MSLRKYLFIWSGIITIIEVKNDPNFGDFSDILSDNSSQTNSNDTNIISTEGKSRLNSILLFVYLLSIGVFVVLYYLKTNNMTDIQQFLVLLCSGLSNVLTGVLLFEVKQTPEFKQIDGLLILIQPLMGLKGNLEMTMASRMSTLMNIREDVVSYGVVFQEIADDIILVLSQAIVVSLVTTLFAILGLLFESIESFNGYNAINLCAISLLTATTASFLLGIFISLLIVFTKKLDQDPDDIATPMAASLGDFVTLLTMVGFVFFITHLRAAEEFPVESFIMIVMLLFVEPIVFSISYQNPKTRPVLIHGWTPIIIATIISSFSGMIFTHSNNRYQKLATFQPLFNGFAGNCLALLASRISTSLHRMGPIGTTSEEFTTFVSPYYAFRSESIPKQWKSLLNFLSKPTDNRSARTTTILLFIVIPSQLLYILLISVLQDSIKFKLTLPFVVLYLMFSLIQIASLLYFAYNLTHFIWKLGYDPDMNVIPILTAMADLSGTIILFLTYYLLEIFGDPNAL